VSEHVSRDSPFGRVNEWLTFGAGAGEEAQRARLVWNPLTADVVDPSPGFDVSRHGFAGRSGGLSRESRRYAIRPLRSQLFGEIRRAVDGVVTGRRWCARCQPGESEELSGEAVRDSARSTR
jgi:hypothetical protein